MKPESITNPVEIRQHVEHFKRQAKHLEARDVRIVLGRFPFSERASIYAEVKPFLPEQAWLSEESQAGSQANREPHCEHPSPKERT